MIRVLIADDHPIVRTGLERLIGGVEDMDVVATAADGNEAVALSTETTPDVVLMDLQMPGIDGVEATRRILAENPESHVVMLTSFSGGDQILRALDAGALGYLLKDAEPDELLRGIRAAARGESPLTPKAAATLVRRQAAPPGAELSEREREVLRLVAEGLQNKQIARRLEISEKTVKAHLTRIFQEIGVTDRTQAALWAERQGLTG